MVKRPFPTAVVMLTVFVLAADVAYAATITQPAEDPVTVLGDASGNPLPFTIIASGFSANQAVSIEQCDGVPSTTPGWSPLFHCDIATAPAPALANTSGVVTFNAADANHAFHPFKGESPQSQFNCLSATDPSSGNGLTDYRNCQFRVASNLSVVTSDQVFKTMVLPNAAGTTPPPGGTLIGGCSGQVGMGSFVDANNVATTLGDQTAVGLTVKMKLLKGVASKTTLGGTCTAAARPGAPELVGPPGPAQSNPLSLTPKSLAAKLVGNQGCAQGPAAQAVDATAVKAWPANGKVTWTMSQLDALGKPWLIQANVVLLGFNADEGPDVVNIGGIVLKGPAIGATVVGDLWQDPVVKESKGEVDASDVYDVGYKVDASAGLNCANGTANDASIAQAIFGSGGTSAQSLLGSTTNGIGFFLGQ